MYSLWQIIKKEWQQLLGDKIALLLMLLMPLLLVFVITIIQHGAYQAINENKITLSVINRDNGQLGKQLITSLEATKKFEVKALQASKQAIQKEISNSNALIGLDIPSNFSNQIHNKAGQFSKKLLIKIGLNAADTTVKKGSTTHNLKMYFAPMLKNNTVFTIKSAIKTQIQVMQSQIIIQKIYASMGIKNQNDSLVSKMLAQKVNIETKMATRNVNSLPKNATQHNVPAWTLFALFFLVIGLGNNLVKEKRNGSFQRIRLAPVNFSVIISAKMFCYLLIAFFQIALLFSAGIYIFPLIDLPALVMPDNTISFILICFLCSMVALSFAMVVGSFAKTPEQSNGVGSMLVVIFAAIGGIWVPVFIMPDIMQVVSLFSPMRWCLDAFYKLFIINADLSAILEIVVPLCAFVVICQLIAFIKLKIDHLI